MAYSPQKYIFNFFKLVKNDEITFYTKKQKKYKKELEKLKFGKSEFVKCKIQKTCNHILFSLFSLVSIAL